MKRKRSYMFQCRDPMHGCMLVLMVLLCVALASSEAAAFSINGGTYKTLTSYDGIKTFDYSAASVREKLISADMVDAAFSFKTASKAVDEWFGKTDTYHTKDGTVQKGFYLDRNTKGKCGVRYNRLFQYNSIWVDVKTTYTNWSLKDNARAFAQGGFCKVWWTNVKWLKMKHEFYISGTNTPIEVKGFFTYADVDDAQGIGIPAGQIQKLWVNAKGTILKYKKEDGITLIRSDDIIIPNKNHEDYSAAKAAKAMFSYEFSGKIHTQYILDGNADSSENVIGFDAAKYIPSRIPSAAPPAIEKTVSDQDEKNVKSNQVSHKKQEWTYTINGLVPLETEKGNFYRGFTFEDLIDECLEIQSVRVMKNETQDVTGQFTVNTAGQKITASSKEYGSATFYGCNYQLKITVKMKETVSLEMLKKHGHYSSETQEIMFKNSGMVIYRDGNGSYEKKTNTVETHILLPQLEIRKESDKTIYKTGDRVQYRILVTQTRKGTTAMNIRICDIIPQELIFKEETLEASGVKGIQQETYEDHFLVTIPQLSYGEQVIIDYEAEVRRTDVDKQVINEAEASADWIDPVRDIQKITVSPFGIEGVKRWDDQQDQDGIRPQQLKVQLIADGEKIRSTVTDAEKNWTYTFKNLERFDENGKEISYSVEEEPVEGYSGSREEYNLMNRHVPEQKIIKGKKIWNDAENLDGIRPKKIRIYLLADGKPVASRTVSEENQWSYSWTVDKYRDGGIEIQYDLKETSVEGYHLEQKGYDLINTHVPYAIRLHKYEALEDGTKTRHPVSGAEYSLYRKGQLQEPDICVGRYTTDEEGTLLVKKLQPGDYFFMELKAPKGYAAQMDPIPVKIQEVTEPGNITEEKVTECTVWNQREYGSVEYLKQDDKGNSVPGAVFQLYTDPECRDSIGTYETDERGMFLISRMKWGTYYLKETEIPKGYRNTDTVQKVSIGPENLSLIIHGINYQKKGKVILTKTDETETIPLKGAVYELYSDSGNLLVESLITDDQGQVEVGDLDWGGYYFKEKKAPEGYGLSMDPIRFSVNSTTGGMTQYVQATDQAGEALLNITKEVIKDDIYYAHGIPCFVFKVTGTAADGQEKTYYQMMTFTKDYVEKHGDTEGLVQKSITFSGLKPGTYSVEEIETFRFTQKEIKDISANGKVSGKKAEFQLDSGDEGHATFVNMKNKWQDYSDTAGRVNMLKMLRKLTGLIADYRGPAILEGNCLFPEDALEVTAVYDDGSEQKLEPGEYRLEKEDGNILDHVPASAGVYTAVICYEENGIMRRQTISYEVEAVRLVAVTFDMGGAPQMSPVVVNKYSCLEQCPQIKTAPTWSGYMFTGWYQDPDRQKKVDMKEMITEDRILYAGWREKHLEDYSWEEIKTISESGNAQVVFEECFRTVKEDMADGVLSQDSLRHTKSFELDGECKHAVISGFHHDQKPDGSWSGISFMIYESLARESFNPQLSNTGGWKESQIRKTVSAIEARLPEEMRQAIAIVKKGSALDRLWLFSQSEIYGAWGYDDDVLEPSVFAGDEDYGELKGTQEGGSQYALFQGLVPDGEINKENALAKGDPWWLRTPYALDEKGFCYIDERGAAR